MGSWQRDDGQIIYSPDVRQADADVLNHWKQRAESVRAPTLAARYNDLLWDLSKLIADERRQVDFARRVAPERAAAACSGEKRTAPVVDLARPETWRVSFRLQIPPEPPPPDIGPRIRSLGPSRFIRAVVVDAATMAKKLARIAALRAAPRGAEANERAKAERLARRFEALRRVIADPAPRARRLKRKLLALERRAFAAARRIALRAPPKRQIDPLFHERAECAASCASPAFFTPDSS
jgi:hypothetical protein